MAMYGSGVVTGTEQIIIKTARDTIRGGPTQVVTVYFAAVAGTLRQIAAVRLVAAGTVLQAGTTSSVFVVRRPWLSNVKICTLT